MGWGQRGFGTKPATCVRCDLEVDVGITALAVQVVQGPDFVSMAVKLVCHKAVPPRLVAGVGNEVSIAELVNKISRVGEIVKSIRSPAT